MLDTHNLNLPLDLDCFFFFFLFFGGERRAVRVAGEGVRLTFIFFISEFLAFLTELPVTFNKRLKTPSRAKEVLPK